MVKKILFLILLFCLSNIYTFAFAEVIPLKKPNQSKEETAKKLLIDVLKPLPKPIKKSEEKKSLTNNDSFILNIKKIKKKVS